jgi:ribosomal protein S18 acetylase RimI-like enzyme
MLKWNKKELKKYNNIQLQIERLREKYAPPDHIYIMLLGVNPSFQKQGHARKLLNLAISRSKEEKIPLYLETFKPVNEVIYQHFGFKTQEKYPIPNSNIVLYSMLRDC